jgi:hypothetical protein
LLNQSGAASQLFDFMDKNAFVKKCIKKYLSKNVIYTWPPEVLHTKLSTGKSHPATGSVGHNRTVEN